MPGVPRAEDRRRRSARRDVVVVDELEGDAGVGQHRPEDRQLSTAPHPGSAGDLHVESISIGASAPATMQGRNT